MEATARLLWVLVVIGLSGCVGPESGEPSSLSDTSVSEPPFALPSPPPPGQGRIYFYRSDLPLMAALAPEIVVNGRRIGQARYEAVFYRDARPGRYEVFLASEPDEPLYFTLSAGELRFVKAVVQIGLTGTRLAAELVEEVQARREIAAQHWARTRPPEGPQKPS